jgi:hypothetical protein
MKKTTTEPTMSMRDFGKRAAQILAELQKTLLPDQLQNRRTLVLVPSLSLISQTLSEWGRTSRHPFVYWSSARTAAKTRLSFLRVTWEFPSRRTCVRSEHSSTNGVCLGLLAAPARR